jgi:hypothetical protein
MRGMVVEFPLVVQDGVIRVVQFEQVLQGPSGLFVGCVDIMDPHWWDVEYCLAFPGWKETERG